MSERTSPQKKVRRIKEIIRLFGAKRGLSREGLKQLLPLAYHDVVHNWWGGRTDRPRSQMDVVVVLSAISLTTLQLDLCLALLDYPTLSLFRKQLSSREQEQLGRYLDRLADPVHDLHFIKSAAFGRLLELGYAVKGEAVVEIINPYYRNALNEDEVKVLELMSILPAPVKETYLLLLGGRFTQNMVDALSALQNYELIEYTQPGYLTVSNRPFLDYIAQNMSPSRHSFYTLSAIRLISQLANEERTDLAELYERIPASVDSSMIALLLEEEETSARELARFYILLGEAYVLWTKYEEGEKNLLKGLRLTNQFPPKTSLRAALVILLSLSQLGFLRLRQSIWPRWAANREQRLLASRGYSRLVEVQYHKGRPLFSICYAYCALLEAEKGGDSKELAEALTHIANLYYFLRLRRTAKKMFIRATRLIEVGNDAFEGHYVYLVKSTYELAQCHWVAADESIEKMIQLARGKGIYRRLQDGLQIRVIYAYLRGDSDSGLVATNELLRLATRHANVRFRLFAHFALAYFTYLQGEVDKALVHAQTLDEQLRQATPVIYDHQLQFNHFSLLSLLQLTHGDVSGSLQAAQEADRYSEGRFKSSFYTLPAYQLQAKLFLTLWQQTAVDSHWHKQFRRKSKAAVQDLGQFAAVFPLGKPAHALYHGLLLELQGRPRRATAVWQEGLQLAETLELPLERRQLQNCLAGKGSPLSETADITALLAQ